MIIHIILLFGCINGEELVVTRPSLGYVSELGNESTFSVRVPLPVVQLIVVRISTDAPAAVHVHPSLLTFTVGGRRDPQMVAVAGVRDGRTHDRNVTLYLHVESGASDQQYSDMTVHIVKRAELYPVLEDVLYGYMSTMDGWPMVLTGDGFAETMSVHVGGVAASNVSVVTPSRVHFTSPPMHHPGYKGITLRNGNGATLTVFPLEGIYYTAGCSSRGFYGAGLCQECPAGAVCPGGPRLWAQPGYWVEREDAAEVTRCIPAEACLGGRRSTCAEGYHDTYCGRCAPSYRRKAGQCVPCGGGRTAALYVLADTGVYVGLCLAQFLLAPATLMAAMSVLSVVSVVRLVASMGYRYMPPVGQFIVDLLVVSTGEALREEGCSGQPEPFLVSYWSGVAIFFAGLLALVLLASLSKMLSMMRRAKRGRERSETPLACLKQGVRELELRQPLVNFLSFTYVNMAMLHLRAMHCVRLPVGPRLYVDPAMRCFTRRHWIQLLVPAVLFFLFHMVLFPLFLASRSNTLLARNPFSFLMIHVRPVRRFYRAAVHIPLLILAAVRELLDESPITQAALCSCTLLGFTACMGTALPWKQRWANHLACVALVAAYALAFVNLILKVNFAMAYLVISIVALLFCACFMAVIKRERICERHVHLIETVGEDSASLNLSYPHSTVHTQMETSVRHARYPLPPQATVRIIEPHALSDDRSGVMSSSNTTMSTSNSTIAEGQRRLPPRLSLSHVELDMIAELVDGDVPMSHSPRVFCSDDDDTSPLVVASSSVSFQSKSSSKLKRTTSSFDDVRWVRSMDKLPGDERTRSMDRLTENELTEDECIHLPRSRSETAWGRG